MRIACLIGLAVAILLFLLTFSAAFSDILNQRCGWSGVHGNCPDARGAMAVSAVAIVLAALCLVWLVRKGRA